MRDPNDWEDYAQWRRLLILKGCPVKRSCQITEHYVRLQKSKQRRFEKIAPVIHDRMHSKKSGSTLKAIVDPDSSDLRMIPPYFRYVAYVLSEGTRQAAGRLGVSRCTLYRWIVKNKFIPKHVIVHDTKRRARKPKALSLSERSDAYVSQ